MRPKTNVVGRWTHATGGNYVFVSEEESTLLASSQEQERRSAARAQSVATLHKVGCSWTARAPGVVIQGSAGPTTPPRFEPRITTPGARPSGEPTVSHEGCSRRRLLLRSCLVTHG